MPADVRAAGALTLLFALASGRIRHLTALAALAADLPATILAGLLGMHVRTAVRWVTCARRDWAGDLAARVADTGKPCRDE
jgi:hypothetical protein